MANQNYSPHFLYKFGGSFGSEEWSCGLRMRITPYGDENGTILDEVAESFLDAQDEAFDTFARAMGPFLQTGVSFSWSSMNHINREGKYSSPNSHTRAKAAPITGSTQPNWTGPDTAVAVTLLTAVQRGYASKGRIYLPLSVFALTTSAGPEWGTIPQANRTTIATATANFLSALNNLGTEMATSNPSVLGASCTVCVFSPGMGQKQNQSIPGAYHPVTKVRVGGQLDVQQRRLNKVDDLWLASSASVSVAP